MTWNRRCAIDDIIRCNTSKDIAEPSASQAVLYKSDMLWVDNSVCWFRIPGDVAMALSFPILWYRLYRIGVASISVETQILLLIAFLLRYTDSNMFNISAYNSAMKLWYILGSAFSVALLLFHFRVHVSRPMASILPTILLSVIFSFVILFPGIMYFQPASLITEISWGASYWIAAGAVIPQLMLMYKTASPPLPHVKDNSAVVHSVAGIDSGLWAYMASICAFRVFYLRHWVWRWQTERFIDLSSQVPSVVQLIVIFSFVLAIVVKVATRRRCTTTITEHAKDTDSAAKEPGASKEVSKNEDGPEPVVPARMLPLIVVSEVV